MSRLRPESSQSEERSRNVDHCIVDQTHGILRTIPSGDRNTVDQSHGILRTTPSRDRTNSNGHDQSRPGINIQESHQANTQFPLLLGRSTGDHVDTKLDTSSFTHLRRNAISEGMPDVDDRTGRLSTRELAQSFDLERHSPAQVSPAKSFTWSTEAVLNGGDTDDDGGDGAVHGEGLVTAGIRGKQQRSDHSDDDGGRSPKRQG